MRKLLGRSKQQIAEKIYPPKKKSINEIHQEYLNKCASVGDFHLAVELNRAKLQKATLEASQLLDEYQAAKKAKETEEQPPASAPAGNA